ncbi:hypothetical protein [Halopiger xanaduensis]|uniref:Uncharacterized protein n=1 Tax=Halopiger xanaduensis (strain DSM 18323 / JCM 14033 / SH-6) TaxID=797210 RepID=F8D548_HALXS|nr:hypothetical protein [Halopiger xanaduensis]AEH36400.1 hypothetical protein Halxa_1772 [Halopiger xanaduensis SH-6]
MNQRHLRWLYVVGIAFNLVAMASAASTGAMLYAVTFGLVTVYLGARYWMIARS